MGNRWQQWAVKLLAVISVVIILWVGFLGWHAFELYRSIQSANALINEIDIQNPPLDQAVQITGEAQNHTLALKQGLSPILPLFNIAGGVLAQVQPGLEYADGGLTAAHLALKAALGAYQSIQNNASGTESDPLAQLSNQHEAFTIASQAMDQAVIARQKLNLKLIPTPISEKIARFDPYLSTASAALKTASLLPELAGFDKESTYILVVQNSDELRATGGFISAVGLLRIAQGHISHIDMSDSYMADSPTADYPQPPPALSQFMGAGMWVLRDANWSPDFPTSAREIEALYKLSVDEPVDGVIAIDQSAVQMLLQALGPVTLEGSSDRIDAKNVITWMHELWSPQSGEAVNQAWWIQRKSFMPLLSKAMLDQLYQVKDGMKLKDLAWTALEAIRQGHIQAYFHQPDLQDILIQEGLDGGVHPEQGDFLYLIDSNVGFNKTDAVVKRQMNYQVDLSQPEAPHAQLTASYTHSIKQSADCVQKAEYGLKYEDMMVRCYWDYWRVLTAPGSKLLKTIVRQVPGSMLLTGEGWYGTVQEDTAEAGTTQFDGLLVLPTDQTTGWTLDWQLPAEVISRSGEQISYTLKVQKQAGLLKMPLTIEITPPDGMTVSAAGDDWKPASSGSSWIWTGTIDRTMTFQLIFIYAPVS